MALSPRQRARLDAAVFLGPACALLALFFVAPIFVNIAVAFSEMSQTVRFGAFSGREFAKMFAAAGDAWLGFALRTQFYNALALTAVFTVFTLAIFNVGFGLVLALATTALPDRQGAFFRAIWLLPRMSPSVVYALLWLWVVDSAPRGLLNQIVLAFGATETLNLKLHHPMVLIVVANGLIGASLGMIIFTSAIRAIPQHLFHAARVDGAGSASIVRHVVLPALRWPISYITIYQTLALVVSFEYIFLLMGPARSTMTLAMLSYTKTLAPGIGAGQYAYGAAISLILIVVGIVAALALWRFIDMGRLLQRPRIETR